MIKTIFNPFRYIAGAKSLIAGLLILMLTAFIGYLSNTHFPDLISIKMISGFPFMYYLLQSLSNWIVFSALLYLTSLFISPSSVRAIDIFGTQAMARFPYIFASLIGFSGSMKKFGDYIMYTVLKTGDPVTLSTGNMMMAISLMILTLLLTIWLVVLMYNAFRVSANVKGARAVISFIIVFIVSVIVTGQITKILITYFS